eukprot:scaffold1629_cov369-Prasinococcus_capsulatus_cf.AAC.6
MASIFRAAGPRAGPRSGRLQRGPRAPSHWPVALPVMTQRHDPLQRTQRRPAPSHPGLFEVGAREGPDGREDSHYD